MRKVSKVANHPPLLRAVDHIGDAVGYYQTKIFDNFQYGQLNDEGDLMFLVYHPKERLPYQVRCFGISVLSPLIGC